MRLAPKEMMDERQRSPESFTEWFTRVSGADILDPKIDPEKLRAFLRSRDNGFYQNLLDEYTQLHEDYPGGVRLPKLSGRRPLVWEKLDTAGEAPMGGADYQLPFFAPLAYEGVIFPDGIALTQYILREEDSHQARIGDSIAWGRVQTFFDILIDYGPLIRTGQVGIITESVAFGIVEPREEFQNAWLDRDLQEAILSHTPDAEPELSKLARLLGYLNLADAYDAEPVLSDLLKPVAGFLYDHIALAAFAGAPECAYTKLPVLRFDYLFTPEAAGMSARDRAKTIARMGNSEYWSKVRQVFTEAAEEPSRAAYNLALIKGMERVNNEPGPLPPIVGKIASEYGTGRVSGFILGASIDLASFVGLEDLAGNGMAQDLAEAFIGASLGGTAEAVARRFSRKGAAADIVNVVCGAVSDPDPNRVKMKPFGKLFSKPETRVWP